MSYILNMFSRKSLVSSVPVETHEAAYEAMVDIISDLTGESVNNIPENQDAAEMVSVFSSPKLAYKLTYWDAIVSVDTRIFYLVISVNDCDRWAEYDRQRVMEDVQRIRRIMTHGLECSR